MIRMKHTQYEHILALLERISRIIHNDAGLSDMKPAQWEALRYLASANRFSRTPSSVVAYLGVTKGTVSQTLNALERKGLISKEKDIGDKRSVSLQLTHAGEALLEDDPLTALKGSLQKLSKVQRDALSEMLGTLLTSALEQRSGTPFGACKTCKHFEKNAPDGDPHRCGLLDVALSSEDSDLICREHAA